MCIGTLSKIIIGGIIGSAAVVIPVAVIKTGKTAYQQGKAAKNIIDNLEKEDDEINSMIDELNCKGFNL